MTQAAKTIAKDVKTGGSAVATAVTTVSQLLSDPALPEVACRVGQLYAIENKKPVPPCPNLARSSNVGGVGLRKAVPILRALVFAEQNPWVKPVAVGAVLGLPLLLGYILGKRSR